VSEKQAVRLKPGPKNVTQPNKLDNLYGSLPKLKQHMCKMRHKPRQLFVSL